MPSPSPHVRVEVKLRQIRQNVTDIRQHTGVPVIAVIKADAYGLGARQVAPAIADLVDSFCVFKPEEAQAIDLWKRTGKEAIAIGPPTVGDSADYAELHVRPAVSTVEQNNRFARSRPVLCVDTGQQRFACNIECVEEMLRTGSCDEAFTHATTLGQVGLFRSAVQGQVRRMHAAGSSLLAEPNAWLDAVRPGLALYQNAVRVTTTLVEVRKSRGRAGYTGFDVPWHGVILAGYSNGLRTGPCLVGGRPSGILEVGMQSAFVEVAEGDTAGNTEVVLLGDGLSEAEVANAWNTSPHEALLRLATSGNRTYLQA
jgi:alanine racemase